METLALVVRWHEGADVAHQEQLARAGTGQQVGHQTRIAAADEQRHRVLAIVNQQPEVRTLRRESVRLEALKALQQFVGHGS